VTKGEMTVLEMLIGEFREFRDDDRSWKEDTNKRLNRVEQFVTSKKAVEERDTARGVSRRAYVAATVAAAGVTASIVLGILNLVT
jgi:hypothetical protein